MTEERSGSDSVTLNRRVAGKSVQPKSKKIMMTWLANRWWKQRVGFLTEMLVSCVLVAVEAESLERVALSVVGELGVVYIYLLKYISSCSTTRRGLGIH